NDEAMAAMLRKIARREGFGAILAEGVAAAARLIGRGAEAAAFHSKGLELTGYDPRGAMGTALGYAVSTRGGDFTSVYAVPEYRWDAQKGEQEFGNALSVDRFSPEGKGTLVRRTIAVSAALDSLGICKVPVLSVMGDFSLRAEAELAAAISGWDLSPSELLTAGERVVTAEKLFNIRHGAGLGDDRLPAFFNQVGLAEDPNKNGTVEVAPMVRDFYAAMGWDEEGRPTAARVAELGLGQLVEPAAAVPDGDRQGGADV
ncbi:MAG: aldehyde ferredoxin oxidoreductase C-terminal domain-containing protein, partial [Chloroflexota bacterium]